MRTSQNKANCVQKNNNIVKPSILYPISSIIIHNLDDFIVIRREVGASL